MPKLVRYSVLIALILIPLVVGPPALRAATSQQLPTATPTATTTASATSTVPATPAQIATAEPITTPRPTATATPAANARPDNCEENNSREHACNLPLDTVSGPFTFLPEGDQDWYRVDLGVPNGLQPSIVVRASGTLDLLVSISRDDGTPLTAYSSPAISTTLAADIGGPVIIRVENRSPDDPSGSSYNVEVRKILPLAPTPPASEGSIPTLTPDIGENNWNPETAAPLAVGVIYDLNFTCPVSWGCGGGDHDYFAVPVKAGGKYLIATFDLGPGVDTVIDLFWGNADAPLTSNDDYGSGMLSVIRWVAPANGTAIVRVGPRNGGMQPLVDDKQSGFYRLAVAVAGTELEQQLTERINAQGNIPTPTPRPAPPAGGGSSSGGGASGGGAPSSPPPAGGTAPRPAPIAANDAPKGEAVVSAESTALREAPDQRAAAIMTLPQERIVTLLGQASGTYVRVQPKGGVIPGWVRAADLQLLDHSTSSNSPSATPAGPATSIPAGQPTAAPVALPGPATSPAPAAPQVRQLPTATPVGAAAIAQRVPLTLTVQLLQSTRSVISEKDPPSTRKLLNGVRVQLVNAFGDVLTEAVTPADGQVVLTRDIEPGAAVLVRLPAMGAQVVVDPNKPTLTITIPAGGAK